MKVLVTGASGLLGLPLCRALCAAGERVRALHLPGDPMPADADCEVEDWPADLRDGAAMTRAVEDCEHVYHAAGRVSYARRDAAQLHAVHVEGTRNLAAAAHRAGVARFVYTSSVAAIGYAPGALADEDTPYNFGPLRVAYIEAKRAAEQVVASWAKRGLSALIVNPGGLVGPLAPSPHSVALLQALQRGRLPALPRGGLNLVSAEDAARGHLLAARRGRVARRYILGGENLSHLEWASEIARALEVRAPSHTLPGWLAPLLGTACEWAARATKRPPPPLTQARGRLAGLELFYSSRRAERELGYRARPLRIAVEETVAWCERQGRLAPRNARLHHA